MARAKCKRGTKLTEKVRLLSPAAEALLLQGGKKSSPLLRQVVVATTCTTTKGDRVVVKATVKKGNLGGANREVVGRAIPRSKRAMHREVFQPDPVAQRMDAHAPPLPPMPMESYGRSYESWSPDVMEVTDSDIVREFEPSGQGKLLGLGGTTVHVFVTVVDLDGRDQIKHFTGGSVAAIKKAARAKYPGHKLLFGNRWTTNSYGAH